MQFDKGAIFSDILRRNALRREARLPTFDVRATYEREVLGAEWRAHVAQHQAETREKVVAQLRAQHGQDYRMSAGGRWAITLLTRKALENSFRSTRLS